jgi:hypothetical protein
VNATQKEARNGECFELYKNVSSIWKEYQEVGDFSLTSPGRLNPKPTCRKAELDLFDKQVIRNAVQNFYLVQN